MYRYNKTEKVAVPPLASKRLLDQVRERIRYLHYSLKTEKAYLYWVRFFVLWSARQGGMRHPKVMGAAEVEAFLTMLANELQQRVRPDGLAIVMEADHFCMHWRGVKDDESAMVNSVMRGAFLKDASLRREFLSLLPRKN